MKLGRNDPCRCGSGKKYKKCCLDKDSAKEATAAGGMLKVPGDGRSSETRIDGEAEDADSKKWRKFWDEYSSLPIERQLAKAKQMIDEEPEFDGDLALDLLDGLVPRLQQAGRAVDVDLLLDHLETKQPLAFQEVAPWLNSYRIENAFVTGRDLAPVLQSLAQNPVENIDGFFHMMDQVRYHGKGAALIPFLAGIRDKIDASNELFDDTKYEFRSVCLSLIFDEQLTRFPDLVLNDPKLMDKLEPFFSEEDSREDRMAFMEARSGRIEREWTAEAFLVQNAEARRHNLFLFSQLFAWHLESQHHWQKDRATMAAWEIYRYCHDKDRARKEEGVAPQEVDARSLLPQPGSAEKYIVGILHFANPNPHRAAVFWLALHLWIECLERTKLVESIKANRLKEALRAKLSHLPELMKRLVFDPVLQQDLAAGWRESE